MMDSTDRFIRDYLTDDSVDFVRFQHKDAFPGFDIIITYKDGSFGYVYYKSNIDEWVFASGQLPMSRPE